MPIFWSPDDNIVLIIDGLVLLLTGGLLKRGSPLQQSSWRCFDLLAPCPSWRSLFVIWALLHSGVLHHVLVISVLCDKFLALLDAHDLIFDGQVALAHGDVGARLELLANVAGSASVARGGWLPWWERGLRCMHRRLLVAHSCRLSLLLLVLLECIVLRFLGVKLLVRLLV